MRLAKVGMYAIDPLPSIPFGIDQARALDMSNVTEHNDIDAFGLEASDLLTVSEYFNLGRKRSTRPLRATP
jgi:NADH dehydrogenase